MGTTCAPPATPSAITSPANGSTLAGSAVTFNWNAGTGTITERLLYVGTSLGGSEIYVGYQGAGLSRTVTGIPTDGRTIYVRLMSFINGSWQTNNYTYTAANVVVPTPSVITAPIPGTTFSASAVNFEWSAGGMVTSRTLSVGSTLGGSQYYGPANQGSALSVLVINLPTNGSTVYVRLSQVVNGVSQSTDYTYTAATVASPSAMTSPANGSTLAGSSVTFNWNAGSGVTERYFTVGSTNGGSDIYAGYQGAGLSRTVTGIPTDGRTIYVRLASWVGGAWSNANYTYTASGTGAPPPCTTAPSAMNSPASGSTLAGASVTFGWTAGCNVTERYLSVGSTAGAGDIYGGYQGAGLSRAINTMPTDGRTVYVTLSSWVSGGWQTSSATYTAASGGGGGPPPAVPQSVISSPTPGSTLGTSATFNWSAGSGVTERYFTVGTTAGGAQVYGGYQGAGLSRTVSGLPTGSVTVYVRLMSYVGGMWIVENYTYTSAP
jgi:hypothetical protein